jgi:hypothetical protein
MSHLRQAHGRGLGRSGLACGVLAALAAALQGVLPAPMAQRLAFACWRSGWRGPAAVASALRRLRAPRRRRSQAGLEPFAALRYAVPLCRRIRVFHDQR